MFRASSAKRARFSRLQKPWKVFDALLGLYLTVAIPTAISLWFLVAYQRNLISPRFYDLISGNGVIASTLALVLGLVVEFAILYYLVKRYKLTAKDFGLRKFNYKKAILYAFCFYFCFAVIVYVVYLLVTVLLPNINLNETQNTGFEFGRQGTGLIISGLVTVLLAPIIEEIFFRGFLLPAFSKRSFFLGALISSLFFGLLHFQLNVAIYTFVFGLFLSYMYYRLGSIVPGMLLHMLNNLVAFGLILLIH